MKRLHFLIDGYNLLHALGMLGKEKLPLPALERVRLRLLDWLVEQFAQRKDAITVVFDASNVPARKRTSAYKGIEVHLARNADDFIEEHLDAASEPGLWIVVSEDRRLKDAARKSRARALGAQEFLDFLEQGEELKAPAEPEKPETLSPEENQALLEEFREVEKDPRLRDYFREF